MELILGNQLLFRFMRTMGDDYEAFVLLGLFTVLQNRNRPVALLLHCSLFF